jgi:hypothetical protein
LKKNCLISSSSLNPKSRTKIHFFAAVAWNSSRPAQIWEFLSSIKHCARTRNLFFILFRENKLLVLHVNGQMRTFFCLCFAFIYFLHEPRGPKTVSPNKTIKKKKLLSSHNTARISSGLFFFLLLALSFSRLHRNLQKRLHISTNALRLTTRHSSFSISKGAKGTEKKSAWSPERFSFFFLSFRLASSTSDCSFTAAAAVGSDRAREPIVEGREARQSGRGVGAALALSQLIARLQR